MMRRSRPFYLAKDYETKIVKEGKCILDETKEYVPAFSIVEFPSVGMRTASYSKAMDAESETMSAAEQAWKLTYETQPSINRVLTQWAHSPEISMRVALARGMKHPKDRATGEEIIMTTDLVLEEGEPGNRRYRCVSVKREEDLTESVLNHFELEAAVCEAAGLGKLTMALDTGLNKVVVANARLIVPSRNKSRLPCDDETVDLVDEYLLPHALRGNRGLAAICNSCDRANGLETGMSLAAVRYLIAVWRWPIDFTKPIAGHLPLPIQPENP